jgi:outer membrane protein TolC
MRHFGLQPEVHLISQPARGHGTLIDVIGIRTQVGNGLAWLACAWVGATAQNPATPDQKIPATTLPLAPSAVVRPLVLAGGVVVEREQPGAIRLTLDEAVATALKQNTEIVLRGEQSKFVHGELLTVGNAFAPNISAEAYGQAQEIDLAALGFKPGTLAGVKINGKTVTPPPEIAKVYQGNAQIALQQAVFNVPAYFLYRAARKTLEATDWQTLNSRGGVVIAVGGLYLRALADQAEVKNAQGLIQQDQLVYEHARASRDAGVGINLDVLRAQVELQQEQQALVQAQNAEAKDKIMLNREMNQPAGQELELVDTIPFAEFDAMPLGDALKLAYERRKDLRAYEAQLEVAQESQRAVKYERLPTLGIAGYYGVVDVVGSVTHGDFAASGQLSFPIFEEGALRGQKEVAVAQMRGLQQQVAATRANIEGEIRSAMLDVQSAAEQVKVARSNVDLGTQALSDATMRFTAGVDDNLPVVRAQAALVGAQTNLVEATFQYNYAKLTLARTTGVVETQYKQYLGK